MSAWADGIEGWGRWLVTPSQMRLALRVDRAVIVLDILWMCSRMFGRGSV